MTEEDVYRSYRQITDPVIRPLVGESPVMGIHLGLRSPNGSVRLGDPVYVGVSDDQSSLSSHVPLRWFTQLDDHMLDYELIK